MEQRTKMRKYVSNAFLDVIGNMTEQAKINENSDQNTATDEEELIVIPTGIPPLDDLLCIGGAPRKKILEIYGEPGGGKSFIAQMILAQATKNYGWGAYFDIEGGLNTERLKELGVVLERLHLPLNNVSFTGEQALESVCNLLYSPEYEKQKKKPFPRYYDVIVIDSIAALGFKNEMEADLVGDIDGVKTGKKVMPGNKARMLSLFSPRILNHLRNSSGYWFEDLSGVTLDNGDFLSFTPDDSDISDGLMKDITDIITLRKDLMNKNNIPKENIHEYISKGNIFRAKLEEIRTQLSQKIDIDIANKIIESIEKNNIKNFYNSCKDAAKQDSSKDIRDICKSAEKIFNKILNDKVILFPTPNQDIVDLERKTRGHIYDIVPDGFSIAQYNPGPVLVIINQVRTGNLVGWGGPTVERPGGFAFKHGPSATLFVKKINSKTAAIHSANDEVIGWKSLVMMEKARYAIPKRTAEITIPFDISALNPFTEFMALCQEKDLWKYTRKYYNLPEDGSIIKTKDELEWKIKLLNNGLDYLKEQLGYTDVQMSPIIATLTKDIASYAEEEESIDSNINTLDDAFEDSVDNDD